MTLVGLMYTVLNLADLLFTLGGSQPLGPYRGQGEHQDLVLLVESQHEQCIFSFVYLEVCHTHHLVQRNSPLGKPGDDYIGRSV